MVQLKYQTAKRLKFSRDCKLSVASCELSVVSWFLSVAILQATNILFIAGLVVVYYDTNA